MEDLVAHEAEVHELCGLHDSIAAEDPDLTFDSKTCPMCAAVQAGMRVIAEQDAEEAKALHDQPGKRRKSDGRTWFLRPKTPEDKKPKRRRRQATSHSM